MNVKRLRGLSVAVLLTIALAATGGLVAGCGDDVPDNAVAKVGDELITKSEYDTLFTQVKAQVKSSYGTFPKAGTSSYKTYQAEVVDYLVQNEVVAQGAKKLGVSVKDSTVESTITQMQTAYGGKATFKTLLTQQGMTVDSLRTMLKARLLSQAAASKVVKNVTVSAADIRSYWQEHKAAYQKKAAKKDKTATFANTKKKIRTKLLNQARTKAWNAWLTSTTKELSVKYAEGYDPAELTASASPSPSASASAAGD